MAANFQHMGGPGQMMPQQQQQRQQQQQQQQQQPQRPQQGGTASTHIQALIFQTLQAQTGPLTGWQAGVLPNERMGLIFNIIGNLRLASQHSPNPPSLPRMIEIGIQFEKSTFDKAANKEQYKHEISMKLDQLLERRNQNQGALQQQITQQAQSQALMQQQNAQQQSQAQQMLMNQQNNMAGQGPRSMPQQPNQQGFSHLQHQMTASPLPGQQPQQAQMGMPNQGLPPNLTQNQQQQFQMNMEQQRSQQNGPGRPGQPQPPQLSAQDNALVMELTNRMMSQTSEEDKNNLRTNLQQRIDPAHLQRYQAQGLDPLFVYFRNQAMTRLRQEKQARMSQAQQLAMGQQGQNIPPSAPAMQQPRSVNPSPLTGQAQAPATMGGNPDFSSFLGNMPDVAAQQQQQGVMAEQAGQMVVPASAPRNATPQPGSMPGQPANMNEQRNAANMNVNAQQRQQQMLHAQQMQQQRLQQSMQQQQSQAQVRMNAQNKAQQMGLQGQPGGMGPGPVPPQQSPAMATLNAPLRAPTQQMNHQETPQVNQAAKFGAPLDPRFMQGNQNRAGQGNALALAGINPALFNSLDPQQQQQIAGLPPDKLNEVVNKWNENRANTAANLQAGRAQMPMGNPQVRPGQQMPQAGQFNPQIPGGQFMNANGGQRVPPSMTTGMSQAQQQLMRQQLANMGRTEQMQPGNMPMAASQDQRLALQMDDMQIPPHLLAHQHMPQGIPTNEIKKWGQLKQWVAQNLNLPPNSIEAVKQLQTVHYKQIFNLRQKQMQAAGLQQGLQGGQAGNPVIPPGMAPVAPMGTNPMQMPPTGMNMGNAIRQPTAFEIQTIRNHPSGKMITATDDQIRALYIKNMQANAMQQGQLTPQQQQQRNQMMQQMQLQRMQQANAQQGHQPGQSQPQANAHLLGQAQVKPVQMPQAKQAQEQSSGAGNNSNAPRNARPQTATKNQAQNSSPAQPAKNLKRANSDDVVEVPNPNIQQARSAQQAGQAPNQIPQMRPNLTPQQIAALDPEKRKKYEAMLKMHQANMQSQTRIMQMDPVMLEKLEAIKREERDNFRDSQHIPMDENARKLTAQMIMAIIGPLNNVGKILSRWFQITSDEEQARKYCRIRLRITKQFKDESMKELKDSFSITAQEVDSARTMMNAMVKDLSERFPHMKKQDGVKPQAGSTAQPPQPAPAPAPAPLNAANLQQQQQQLNKMHQRSNSRSSHVPAAPTSSQPPFQFGAASPHGAPAYIGNSKITQENLHIPARKKQKQNGTPGSNASPQVAKAPSPEIKRQEPRPQAKSTLCCSDPDCERHTVGFESQEALNKHNQEHVRQTENPEKFMGENLALILGLDSQGQAKKVASTNSQTAVGASMAQNASKQGQTPVIKNESLSTAATPMNRQVSMNRQASATDSKPDTQKANLAKDASAKLQSVQKETKTVPQQEPATKADAWANSNIDPHDLLQSFQPFETGAGGAISDLSVYRSITPNDTPESSKDGVSEPNSDISEGAGLDINLDIIDDNWQAFGPSDTDHIYDMNGFNISGGDEDVTMFGDEPTSLVYQSWDDIIDQAAFDKPFKFDTSYYSMNAE